METNYSPLRSVFTIIGVFKYGLRGLVSYRWIQAFAWIAIFQNFATLQAHANNPGGTNGTGPDVTVSGSPTGTITLQNGIVSIQIITAYSRLESMTYVAGTNTLSVLDANQYYYGGYTTIVGGPSINYEGPGYTYTLATDPASNGYNYGDVELTFDTGTAGVIQTHFSMLRGSPGFYSTAILSHRSSDVALSINAFSLITRVSNIFNWLSADSLRNLFIGTPFSNFVSSIPNATHEMGINIDGSTPGQYNNKFFYAQDHGDAQAWGWSSVGTGGANVGVWMMGSLEFNDGGPLKRDVGPYPYEGSQLLTYYLSSGEVGQGSDGNFNAGETWTKVCGPWFTYMNTTSTTGTVQAEQALYQDALNQAAAEKGAWPYSWFSNPAYVPASGRGTVTGTLVVNDSGNQSPNLNGTWVGLVAQPGTNTSTYDFQKWFKPYQYWVKTDSTGTFTIPNVIQTDPATGNALDYTLYAFGPGGAGLYMSQLQNGPSGNQTVGPPLVTDVPSTQFNVPISTGTTSLGNVNWTPSRVGNTVFELGYPDRKADKFRHGEDYWAADVTQDSGYPLPVWGGQCYFPFDFPNGMTYTVGKSKWDTDWNYVLPVIPNAAGGDSPSSGNINFNLASAPANGAQASIYLAAAGAGLTSAVPFVVITVNGVNLGATNGVTATPNPLTGSGFGAPSGYEDDSSVHCSDHGPYWDERITFPANLLQAGTNTITINMNGTMFDSDLLMDYLRLELTGYVPPPPASVTAFAGNNNVLVTWPVVPGATEYQISRSLNPAGPYTTLQTNMTGAVSGSDTTTSTYNDTTAANGTTYYYEVSSGNPSSYSAASPASNAVMPSGSISTTPPAAPTDMEVASVGDRTVSLSWNASAGANYYAISRTTMRTNFAGGTYALRTIVLNDDYTSTNFTDSTPSDDETYSYSVQAVSASGTSTPSSSVTASPTAPAVPPGAPTNLTASRGSAGTSITLSWTPVAGATGYDIYRSTVQNGALIFSANFVNTTVDATYSDGSVTAGKVYYYQVVAVNTSGNSAPATVTVPLETSTPSVAAANQTATLNTPFSYSIGSSNSPSTYSVSGLPAGLSLNSATGVISGTPTATGTFTLTMIATNANGSTSAPLVLTVNDAPVITSPLIAGAGVNDPFTYNITAINNPNGYGATGLPTGLSVNGTTGAITGTVISAGTSTVTLYATNASGVGTATLILNENSSPPVLPGTLADAAATGFLFTYTITGSNTPSSFSAAGLPSGLSLNTTTGVITGTVTQTGTYTVTINASNGDGTSTSTLTLTVGSPGSSSLTWTGTTSLNWDTETPNWVNGSTQSTYLDSDSVTFGDTGNAGTIQIMGTQNPSSITVNASSKTYSFAGPGVLGGTMTLTKNGSTSLSVSGTNTFSGGTLLLNGQIYASGSAAALGTGTLTLGSSGDTNTVVVRADAINLPNNIVVNSGGARWIEPGNSAGVSYLGDVTLVGGATLGLSTVGGNVTLAGDVSGTGNVLFGENGGSRGNSETLSGALNNTGTISDAGSPDTGGANILGAIGTNVTSLVQNSATESMTLWGQSAFNGSITLTTGTLTLTSNGYLGTGTYSGAMADNGLFIYSSTATQTMSGVISGSGALTVNDGGILNLAAADTYTGTTTVNGGVLLVSGSITSPVSVASGGMFGGSGTVTGSVTFAGGSGLVFNVTGSSVQGPAVQGNLAMSGTITVTPNLVSGTLTTGTYTILTYSGSLTGSPHFTWLAPEGSPDLATFSTSTPGALKMTVTVPPPVISSTLTGTVAAEAPFSYTITASNDPTSYNASGLPSGVSVNTASGVISGTPTTAGSYPITLSATNSAGTGTATLNLTVTPPAPAITSSSNVTVTSNLAFNYTIAANYGATSYSVSGLPAGLTLNPTTGAITGTPTVTGAFEITLSATNAYGTGTETLNLTLNPPASLTWTGTLSGNWDASTANWLNGSATATYADPDYVTFDDTSSGGTVTLTGTFNPSSVTFNNSAKGYVLVGTGALSGTMTLTKSGTGGINMDNNNSYSGGTQVLGGQLYVSGTNTVLGTGTLTLGSYGDTGTATVRADSINLPNPVAVYPGGTRWLEPGNGTAVTYTGSVTLNGGATLSLSTVGGNITLSGGITGAGNILFGENGGARGSSETLSGGSVNIAGTISDAGNPDTGGCFVSTTIGTNVTGITQGSTSESMTLSGSNAYNGPVTISSGTFTLGGAGVLGSGTYTGAMTDNGTFNYASTATQTLGSSISGSGGLTVNGSGELILPGANTYTGTTTIDTGTLQLLGSLTSPVSVVSGGTLAGTGTVTGNLTMVNGAALVANITNTGAQGITVNGNLALSGTITVPSNITTGTWVPGSYPLITYSGTLTGTPVFNWITPPNSVNAVTFSTATPGVVDIIINPPAPVITSTLTASGPELSPFSYNITATNAPTGYGASNLPSGLSVNTTTGVISGTPSTEGLYSIGLSASNASGTGTATLSLTVTPPAPAITSSSNVTVTSDLAFNYTITANYDPTSFGASGLPTGLTLNSTSGAITGTPTATGTFEITLSATNAYGTGTDTLTLTLNPPASLTWTGTLSGNWDTTTANWLNGSTTATYADPDYVTFNDTSSGGTITLTGTFNPSSVTFSNSAKSYVLVGAGALSGTMTLTKSGTGGINMDNNNSYSGGTQVLGGQLYVSGTNTVLGTGTLTFGSNGDTGTVTVRANGINLPNPVAVYSGGTRWIEPGNGNAVNYTGSVTLNGGATLSLSTVGGNITLSGGITGTGNILFGENGGARGSAEYLSGGEVNMAGTISDAGNPDTAGCFVSAVIGTNVTGITQSSTTESMTLSGSNGYNGPITISSGTFTLGGAGVLGSGTYTGSISNSGLLIFGSSAEQTWSGIISGSGSFTDKGAGILTLQGANTYTGSTTVASGAVLLVNQSLTSGVTVNSGGVLGGSGTIGTSVTVNSGGEISFNVTSGGVAGLSIQGNLATTGTIYVSPTIVSGSLNSGTYVITSFTGTLTGSPTFDWVPSEGGPSATISTSTPGEIKITVP